MTTYAVQTSGNGTAALTLGVKAGTLPIKLVSIEITSGGGNYTITEYASATLSAGSALTPFPMRSVAPAASSTARTGSPTGTSTVLKASGGNVASGTVITYQTPVSLVLQPGSAIGATITLGFLMVIYFDELEIQPGY